MANHKLSTRVCPVCNIKKTFEVRLKSCSKECADILRKGTAPDVPATGAAETQEMNGDTWAITLPKTRINTLEELLASTSGKLEPKTKKGLYKSLLYFK